MDTLKRIGDKTPPCLTPFVAENWLEVHPFQDVATPCLVYRTTRSIIAGISRLRSRASSLVKLIFCAAHRVAYCHIVLCHDAGPISLYCPWPHDDVIKWKHFPRYWPFVWGIHRSPVNSSHKGQWRGALMYSLICEWTNGGVNNREAGDLGRHRTHYDVIVIHAQIYARFLNDWKQYIYDIYLNKVQW